MIQQQTILKVIDNSGAKTVKCIKILGGFKKKYSFIGEVIIVSVQNLRNKSKVMSKVKKGEIWRALIVRTKKRVSSKDGAVFFFKHNCASLINKQGQPVATRILGPIPKKIKNSKFSKFASLSTGLV